MTDIGNDAYPYPLAPWLPHAYAISFNTQCFNFNTAPEDLTVESVTFSCHSFASGSTLYLALYASTTGALVYEDTTGYTPGSLTDTDLVYTVPAGWDVDSGDGIVIGCRTSGSGGDVHRGGGVSPIGLGSSPKDWHFGPGFPDPGSFNNGNNQNDTWVYLTYTTGGGATGKPFQRKILGNFLELN